MTSDTTTVRRASAHASTPPLEGLLSRGQPSEAPLVRKDQLARLCQRMFGAEGPKTFGRYQIGKKLGAGGMGSVYSAYDPTLDRRVAIKLLRRELDESDRLRREAAAMAAIDHRHIVRVFELGHADGQPYIVMERIEGPTLRDWLRAETRSVDQILQVLAEVADGLDAVHRRGLLHRDLKPSNMLIDPERGAVLIDFGLTQATDDSTVFSSVSHESLPPVENPRDPAEGAPRLTHSGAVVGTPSYMSPEQREGRRLTERSDQWTFALVCWEALFGVRPGQLKPVSELRTPRLGWEPARGKTSPAVRRALERALSAPAHERYNDVAELGSILRAARRTPRWPWVLGSAAALALAIGLWAGAPDHTDATQDRASTLNPLPSLVASTTLAAGRRIAASAEPNDAIAVLEMAFFDSTARGDELAAAKAARSLADVYVVERQQAEAARLWHHVLVAGIERGNLGVLWRQSANSVLAKILQLEMKPDASIAVAEQAIAALAEVSSTAEIRGLQEALWTNIGVCHESAGRGHRAAAFYARAFASASADPNASDVSRLRLKYNLRQRQYRDSPDAATATALFELAEEIESTIGPGTLARYARVEAGQALMDLGRHDEAIVAFGHVLANLDPDDESARPIAARARAQMGSALAKSGRLDEGLRELQTALGEFRRALGDDHLLTGFGHEELATHLEAVGRLAEAETHLRAAHLIVAHTRNERDAEALQLSLGVARLLAKQARTEDARRRYTHVSKLAVAGTAPALGARLGLLTLRLQTAGDTTVADARAEAMALDATVRASDHSAALRVELAALRSAAQGET